MTRWLLLLVLLCACNGNGNGNNNGNSKTKNGGDLDDVHAVQVGVWYCVHIVESGQKKRQAEPCFETLAKCESDRAKALSNHHEAGLCDRYSFAMCFEWVSDKQRKGWSCARTSSECEEWRLHVLSEGTEVTECMRVPPESSRRLRSRRRWRTSRRSR